MEEHDTKLKLLGVTDAPEIYKILYLHRHWDTAASDERPYDDWLVNVFPIQQYFQWGEQNPAFLSIGHIEWINRSAYFGIFCSRPGKGDGYGAAMALFDFGFNTMGLNRMTCTVRADNKRAMRAIEKYAPLKHEGTMLGALYRKGHFVDQAIFAILVDDWRRS